MNGRFDCQQTKTHLWRVGIAFASSHLRPGSWRTRITQWRTYILFYTTGIILEDSLGIEKHF
jgi:hypothetical protein